MNITRFASPILALTLAAFTGAVSAQQPYPQGPPPPQGAYQQGPGYQGGPGGWDAPPGEYREVARQGFRDGMDGARRDVENHRRPNVNNRDEFRHPHVAGYDRRDYRMGFRRGYDAFFTHSGFGPGGPRPY